MLRKIKNIVLVYIFSSRRRHTRWNCGWSSDVCSSDLATDVRCWDRPRTPSSVRARAAGGFRDRKSTRLNSSHSSISYAAFSLKKKNNSLSISSTLQLTQNKLAELI